MLIDEPLIAAYDHHPIFAALAAVHGKDGKTKRLQQGVYEVCHFGSSSFPGPGYEEYADLGEHNSYGVCDDAANLLEKMTVLQDPSRQFVVTLTEVKRDLSNKGQGDGWRWHKWGPYIGKRTPTTEYLDDEPEIERVYVYHVYEKTTGA